MQSEIAFWFEWMRELCEAHARFPRYVARLQQQMRDRAARIIEETL